MYIYVNDFIKQMGGIFGGARALGDRINRSGLQHIGIRYGEKPGASSVSANLDNDIIAPYNGAKGGIANGPEGTGTSAPLFGDAGGTDAGGGTRSRGTGAPETALDKNAGRNPQKTEQFGKVSYTYTETPDAAVTDTARQVSSILKEYGIETVIHDGDMQRHAEGAVSARPMVAATSPDGRVFIANGMDMQPIEVAGHEKIYHFAKANPQEMTEFTENTLRNNLDYENTEVMGGLDEIAEAYMGGVFAALIRFET